MFTQIVTSTRRITIFTVQTVIVRCIVGTSINNLFISTHLCTIDYDIQRQTGVTVSIRILFVIFRSIRNRITVCHRESIYQVLRRIDLPTTIKTGRELSLFQRISRSIFTVSPNHLRRIGTTSKIVDFISILIPSITLSSQTGSTTNHI